MQGGCPHGYAMAPRQIRRGASSDKLNFSNACSQQLHCSKNTDGFYKPAILNSGAERKSTTGLFRSEVGCDEFGVFPFDLKIEAVDFPALLRREIASARLMIAPMPDRPRPRMKLARGCGIPSCSQNHQNDEGNIRGFDRP
jgi:hypothetical protein